MYRDDGVLSDGMEHLSEETLDETRAAHRTVTVVGCRHMAVLFGVRGCHGTGTIP